MRLLLVKTSSLGDVIHNLPVVSDIRRALPQAEIDWVVEESFVEIPRLHAAVSGVIPVAVRRWRQAPLSSQTWREIMAYRRAVRRPEAAELAAYDAVIDTQGLIKSAWLTSLVRGKKYGFAAPREGLAALAYDVAVEVPRDLHAVMRNRLLAAGALGYRLDDLPLDYGIAAPSWKAAWLPRGDYAALLTATSRAAKEWPEDDWRALGMALASIGLRSVLPAGSSAERERAARLANGIGRAIAAPAMNLTELAGLLAGAKLVVGVDTGLVHLAAALGRPTVAIHCASDPKLTGVLGTAPHRNLGGPGQAPSAAAVVKAALELAV
ncbi:lipopolysaccharide heptosyltransferase I [Sulfuricystis multivorans]|uniref:lipopolysaccharide heptosyltransferase I n=1 Tax=Sulfuricystis multivorans TaxID=2211108 RepID=UPI000F835A38|nr:lipopolysaccharide heptosyltransferase I [Sulfuricystis multivorans]